MGLSAQDVISLAKNIKTLSKEQLTRILEVAPNMGPTDLEKLKHMIEAVRDAEIKDMKQELKLRQKVASAYKEWKSDKARNAIKTEEGAVKREDDAQAESLIQNI